jgi:hypothetical protein
MPNKTERARVEANQYLERLCGSTSTTLLSDSNGATFSSKLSPSSSYTSHPLHRVSNAFSHMINPMISTRAYLDIEPVRLYLSLEALRQGKVVVLDEDCSSDDSSASMGIWVEDSGTVSPQDS